MLAMESSLTPPAHSQHTKQYVFVDEYNRHKRLKVMRACDGCRKRKIRCDGALQNGPWPCGACVRLKLNCVPPTLDQDNDSGSETPDSATNKSPFNFFAVNSANPVSVSRAATSSPSQGSLQWNVTAGPTSAPSTAATTVPSRQDDSSGLSERPQLIQKGSSHQQLDRIRTYAENETTLPYLTPDSQHARAGPSLQRAETANSDSSGGDPEEVSSALAELSVHMGDLSVGANSVAPYLISHQRHAPQVSSIDEAILPSNILSDSSMQIPPEMMPHDDRAMDYFNYFFLYIHPYVPVLNKASFLEQWAHDRDSISPLILEAIFACTTQYLDQPIVTKRWLALATKHEEVYKDVLDLSTVQALIILIKAREFSQKPGYYYRSWMNLKYITTMAIDLELHEHRKKHRGNAISCKLDPSECLVKTRIWQTLFMLELFIGGPQGRTDMNVDADTVDMTIPFPAADLDPSEYQISRRCTVLSQCGMNIKHSLTLMQEKVKTNPGDWALDPRYSSYDADLVNFMNHLPSDLQIHYPAAGTAPWLGGDHYVAGLHLYYHLVVIQHHRPQLQAKLDNKDPAFKQHLDICARSATTICRIHEALYRDFDLHGLLFMLRGINFTVYSILTCTMLHLVAITSPDPILNSQARDYFTRHMRILEHCITTASPEMQMQIHALREAFSIDTSMPFELKPTLGGMRSPSSEKQLTPPISTRSTPNEQASIEIWPTLHSQAIPVANSPISELEAQFGPSSMSSQITSHPVMAYVPDEYSTASTSIPTAAPYGMDHLIQRSTGAANGDVGYPLQQSHSNEMQTPIWDPSGIIDQWHTAFGNPVAPPQMSPSPEEPRMLRAPIMTSSGQMSSGPTSMPMLNQNTTLTHSVTSHPQNPMYSQNLSPVTSSLMSQAVGAPAVTSMMWQDAFTSAYVSGHNKRHRDGLYDDSVYSGGTKRRG